MFVFPSNRILDRRHASAEDLTNFGQAKKDMETAVPSAQTEESVTETGGQEDEELPSVSRQSGSRLSQTTASSGE